MQLVYGYYTHLSTHKAHMQSQITVQGVYDIVYHACFSAIYEISTLISIPVAIARTGGTRITVATSVNS